MKLNKPYNFQLQGRAKIRNETQAVIRITGKAKLVFEIISALAQKHGEKTLGELIKADVDF